MPNNSLSELVNIDNSVVVAIEVARAVYPIHILQKLLHRSYELLVGWSSQKL